MRQQDTILLNEARETIRNHKVLKEYSGFQLWKERKLLTAIEIDQNPNQCIFLIS